MDLCGFGYEAKRKQQKKILMKKIFLIVILFFPLKSFAVGDHSSPKDILTFYSDPSTKYTIIAYFKGLGGGYSWYNSMLNNLKRQKVFCVPNNKSFNGEEYYAIYRAEYLRNKELYDKFDLHPLD